MGCKVKSFVEVLASIQLRLPSVEQFVSIACSLADDNPQIRRQVHEAAKEIRAAGQLIDHLRSLFEHQQAIETERQRNQRHLNQAQQQHQHQQEQQVALMQDATFASSNNDNLQYFTFANQQTLVRAAKSLVANVAKILYLTDEIVLKSGLVRVPPPLERFKESGQVGTSPVGQHQHQQLDSFHHLQQQQQQQPKLGGANSDQPSPSDRLDNVANYSQLLRSFSELSADLIDLGTCIMLARRWRCHSPAYSSPRHESKVGPFQSALLRPSSSALFEEFFRIGHNVSSTGPRLDSSLVTHGQHDEDHADQWRQRPQPPPAIRTPSSSSSALVERTYLALEPKLNEHDQTIHTHTRARARTRTHTNSNNYNGSQVSPCDLCVHLEGQVQDMQTLFQVNRLIIDRSILLLLSASKCCCLRQKAGQQQQHQHQHQLHPVPSHGSEMRHSIGVQIRVSISIIMALVKRAVFEVGDREVEAQGEVSPGRQLPTNSNPNLSLNNAVAAAAAAAAAENNKPQRVSPMASNLTTGCQRRLQQQQQQQQHFDGRPRSQLGDSDDQGHRQRQLANCSAGRTRPIRPNERLQLQSANSILNEGPMSPSLMEALGNEAIRSLAAASSFSQADANFSPNHRTNQQRFKNVLVQRQSGAVHDHEQFKYTLLNRQEQRRIEPHSKQLSSSSSLPPNRHQQFDIINYFLQTPNGAPSAHDAIQRLQLLVGMFERVSNQDDLAHHLDAALQMVVSGGQPTASAVQFKSININSDSPGGALVEAHHENKENFHHLKLWLESRQTTNAPPNQITEARSVPLNDMAQQREQTQHSADLINCSIVLMNKRQLVRALNLTFLGELKSNVVERLHEFTDCAYTKHENRETILALLGCVKFQLNKLVRLIYRLRRRSGSLNEPEQLVQLRQLANQLVDICTELDHELKSVVVEQSDELDRCNNQLDLIRQMKHFALMGDTSKIRQVNQQFGEQSEQLIETCKMLNQIAPTNKIKIMTRVLSVWFESNFKQLVSATLCLSDNPRSREAKDYTWAYIQVWSSFYDDFCQLARQVAYLIHSTSSYSPSRSARVARLRDQMNVFRVELESGCLEAKVHDARYNSSGVANDEPIASELFGAYLDYPLIEQQQQQQQQRIITKNLRNATDEFLVSSFDGSCDQVQSNPNITASFYSSSRSPFGNQNSADNSNNYANLQPHHHPMDLSSSRQFVCRSSGSQQPPDSPRSWTVPANESPRSLDHYHGFGLNYRRNHEQQRRQQQQACQNSMSMFNNSLNLDLDHDNNNNNLSASNNNNNNNASGASSSSIEFWPQPNDCRDSANSLVMAAMTMTPNQNQPQHFGLRADSVACLPHSSQLTSDETASGPFAPPNCRLVGCPDCNRQAGSLTSNLSSSLNYPSGQLAPELQTQPAYPAVNFNKLSTASTTTIAVDPSAASIEPPVVPARRQQQQQQHYQQELFDSATNTKFAHPSSELIDGALCQRDGPPAPSQLKIHQRRSNERKSRASKQHKNRPEQLEELASDLDDDLTSLEPGLKVKTNGSLNQSGPSKASVTTPSLPDQQSIGSTSIEQADKWIDSEADAIVRGARETAQMALSMYQFTRGEGDLNTTQDLFTQAELFAEEANELYKEVRCFSYKVPAGDLKKELLFQLSAIPALVQQLQFTVKNPTVGKAATFAKVDSVIRETRILMEAVNRVVEATLSCRQHYNMASASLRKRTRTLSPSYRGDKGAFEFESSSSGRQQIGGAFGGRHTSGASGSMGSEPDI